MVTELLDAQIYHQTVRPRLRFLLRYMRQKKYINLFAFFLVTLYLGCSPLLLCSLLEFQPIKANGYGPGRPTVNRQDIFFNSKNGKKLQAWYFKNANAKKTALVHHGQAGNVSSFLDTAYALVSSGASVFLYDYEGYGLSEGHPSNANLCDDADAAYEYLVAQKLAAPDDIIEVGLSMGSGLACRMAESRPCAGLILVGAYTSLEQVAKHHLAFLRLYPSFIFPRPDLGIGNLFKEKKTPLLLIHSIQDPLLPIAMADEIYAAAQGPKTYIRLNLSPGVHLGGLSDSDDPTNPRSSVYVCRAFLRTLAN
jgi:uncharacterized protein